MKTTKFKKVLAIMALMGMFVQATSALAAEEEISGGATDDRWVSGVTNPRALRTATAAEEDYDATTKPDGYKMGDNAFAFGENAKATADNSIAFGSGAEATATGAVALGANSIADTANTISVGDGGSNNKQIVNLAAGVNDTDAANVKQASIYVGDTKINNANGAKLVAGAGVTFDTSTAGEVTINTHNEKDARWVSGKVNTTALKTINAAEEDLTSYYMGVDAFATGKDTKASGDWSTAMGYKTTASTYAATALGDETTASGIASTAMGEFSTASGKNSVSMGSHTTASGENSVAMGRSSTAIGTGSLAGGSGEENTSGGTAYGYNSFAFGSGAQAGTATDTGNYTFAFGENAKATANNAIAFGSGAEATSAGAVALGMGSVVTATDGNVISVGKAAGDDPEFTRKIIHVAAGENGTDAVNYAQLQDYVSTHGKEDHRWVEGGPEGYKNAIRTAAAAPEGNGYTMGQYAFAAGYDTYARGYYSTAAGAESKANGNYSVAMGHGAAAGDNAVALGNYATANTDAVALGSATKAEGAYATAISYISKAAGEGSFAGGGMYTTNDPNVDRGGTAYGKNSFAYGYQAEAGRIDGVTGNPVGDYSFAFGKQTKATNDYSVALGSYSEATGLGAVTIGGYQETVEGTTNTYKNTASGEASVAIGAGNIASGESAVTLGTDNTATMKYTTAIGTGNKANGSYATTIGYDNSATSNGIVLGVQSKANGVGSLAIGNNAKANTTTGSGNRGIAIGSGVEAQNNYAIAIGSNETYAGGQQSVAIGTGTSVAKTDDNSTDGAVALGSGSIVTSIDGNVVSIGSTGVERKIIHVANGVNDTDATNYGQVKTMFTTIDDSVNGQLTFKDSQGNVLKTANVKDKQAVHYNQHIDGQPDGVTFHDSMGTSFTQVKLMNVHDGALDNSSTDAVNGRQLWAEQQARIAADTMDAEDGNYYAKNDTTKQAIAKIDTAVSGINAYMPAQAELNGTSLEFKNTSDDVIITAELKGLKTDQGNKLEGYFDENGIAKKATADEDGNTISSTYLKSSDATSTYLSKTDASSTYLSKTAAAEIYATQASLGDYLTSASASATYATKEALSAKADIADVYTKAETYDRATIDEKISESGGSGVLNPVRYTDDTKTEISLGKNGGTTVISNVKAVDPTEGGKHAATTGQLYDTNQKVDANSTAIAANTATLQGVYTDATYNGDKLTLTKVDGSKTELTIAGGSGSGSDNAGGAIAGGEIPAGAVVAKANANGSAVATGYNSQATGEKSVASGFAAKATGDESTAVGNNSNALGDGASAIGNNAKANAEKSIAIGYDAQVTGKDSVAVGTGHRISGSNSGAFGDPSYINADSAYAIGNNNTINGNNSFVLGNNVTVNSNNSVVLGNGSEDGGDNTVSVGKAGGERRIVNVADPVSATDAATKGYVDSSVYNVLSAADNAINEVHGELKEVAAKSAALAGLRYMEPSGDKGDKVSGAISYGGYRGESAGAVGLSYKASENLMVNAATTFGRGEQQYNAGISFKFGKGNTATSRATLAKQVKYVNEKNKQLENKVESQNNMIKKLMERIDKLEKKNG